MEGRENQNQIQNQNRIEEQNDKEFNFLYERLKHSLETYAFIPLNNYNASTLKRCDTEKLLDNEDMNTIKSVFNQMRNHYIDQTREEIKNFMEKYNLKEKLEFTLEVYFYSSLMQELGISLEELKELDEISNLDGNDDSSFMKYYLNKYMADKIYNMKPKMRE